MRGELHALILEVNNPQLQAANSELQQRLGEIRGIHAELTRMRSFSPRALQAEAAQAFTAGMVPAAGTSASSPPHTQAAASPVSTAPLSASSASFIHVDVGSVKHAGPAVPLDDAVGSSILKLRLSNAMLAEGEMSEQLK